MNIAPQRTRVPYLDHFGASLQIIGSTPGYAEVAADLARMAAKNRVRVDETLDARAEAGLLGTIKIGLEAMESSPLSLAQTLVHEHFHLYRQNPFQKTISFWVGVFSRTHVMRRFEQPAYLAASDFLEAVKRARPALAWEAESEQRAIRAVFETAFGSQLGT